MTQLAYSQVRICAPGICQKCMDFSHLHSSPSCKPLPIHLARQPRGPLLIVGSGGSGPCPWKKRGKLASPKTERAGIRFGIMKINSNFTLTNFARSKLNSSKSLFPFWMNAKHQDRRTGTVLHYVGSNCSPSKLGAPCSHRGLFWHAHIVRGLRQEPGIGLEMPEWQNHGRWESWVEEVVLHSCF